MGYAKKKDIGKLIAGAFLCYFTSRLFRYVTAPPSYYSEFDRRYGSHPVPTPKTYNDSDAVMTIMMATTHYNDDINDIDQLHLSMCPKKCRLVSFITSPHEMLTADVVVIHPVHLDLDMRFLDWISHRRRPEQLFVFYSKEPPIVLAKFLPRGIRNLRYFNNHFNLTMSYQRDADIFVPFKNFLGYEPIGRNDQPQVINRVSVTNKRHVAAIIRNCHSSNYNRIKILDDLRNLGLQVDIYGKCGTYTCTGDRATANCYKVLEKKYLFYASFENSICQDYVTEKLYNVFNYDMVPLVIGGGNYKEISPPHSYINMHEFESAESAAQFILNLAGNEEEYNKYFEWKKRYRLKYLWPGPYCEACIKFHEHRGSPYVSRYYENLDGWFTTGCTDGVRQVFSGTL